MQYLLTSKFVFVTIRLHMSIFSGRYDLDDSQIVCNNCNYHYDDRLSSVVSAGYWPGNVSRDIAYMFSQDLYMFSQDLLEFF